jgi:hypothetical protein
MEKTAYHAELNCEKLKESVLIADSTLQIQDADRGTFSSSAKLKTKIIILSSIHLLRLYSCFFSSFISASSSPASLKTSSGAAALPSALEGKALL